MIRSASETASPSEVTASGSSPPINACQNARERWSESTAGDGDSVAPGEGDGAGVAVGSANVSRGEASTDAVDVTDSVGEADGGGPLTPGRGATQATVRMIDRAVAHLARRRWFIRSTMRFVRRKRPWPGQFTTKSS